MPVLNVKPQSIDVGPCRPPNRIPVGLRDHHQTWLANYEEIREEVNKATCHAEPRTIVYRNENGSFGANIVYMEELALGTSNPYASGASLPITLNSTEFRTSSSVTMTVEGPANFSNNVNFSPTSVTTFDGKLISNNNAVFNDQVDFYGLTTFHPSSILQVDGLSYFTEDVTIDADVDMTGDFDLTGDMHQAGNTWIDGNLDIGDDLIVRGNLSVLGDHSTFEVSDLKVEDKNIIVNHGAPTASTDAGIYIQHLVDPFAGYYKVDTMSTDYLTMKAPTAFEMKIDIPIKDVNFRLESDFAADQELLTTSDVAFRSLLLDKSYTRHVDVPSYTQQHDPIAKDRGWLSTPWVYTNAVESNDNLLDANTTGLYMGTTSFTLKDEIALYSHGDHKMFIDHFGNIGFGTKRPISNLHLYDRNPSFTLTSKDYTSTAKIDFTDPTEQVDDSGMYFQYDTQTGYGLLEVTTQSPFTQFAISVGGYQKQPELVITDSTITFYDDVEIYGNAYVQDELVVDNTLYVRSAINKVGINVVSPLYALDVSGTIRGDSDVILDGNEPFILIGPSITALEPIGRSGLHVEEDSPLVELATTSNNYRHGSILYFNDQGHDKHWSVGTVLNGQAIDFGKSHGSGINTPEYGLDEYHGQTFLRVDETDRTHWFLESTNSNPAMRLNTRTNGIHLYLGEKDEVYDSDQTDNSYLRDTTPYTDTDFSSSIQWHGNHADSTIGELTYFPNGNDDWEFGSFRFSRTNGTVNTGHPSAKVGVEQLYAHDKIAVSNTAPTAELHITKDVSQIRQETEDNEKYFQVDVDTSNIILTGNNSTQSTYFQMSAINPAQLLLVSQGTHKSEIFVDKVTDNLKLGFDGAVANSMLEVFEDNVHLTFHSPQSSSSLDIHEDDLYLEFQNPIANSIHEVTNDTVKTNWSNTKSKVRHLTDTNQTEYQITRPDISYHMHMEDTKVAFQDLKTLTLENYFEFNDSLKFVEKYNRGYNFESYYKMDIGAMSIEKFEQTDHTKKRTWIDESNYQIQEQLQINDLASKHTEENKFIHIDLFENQMIMNDDMMTLFMNTSESKIHQSRNSTQEFIESIINGSENSVQLKRGAAGAEHKVYLKLDSSGNFLEEWVTPDSYMKKEMTSLGVITESFSDTAGTGGTYYFKHHTHPIYTVTHDHFHMHSTTEFDEDVEFHNPITINNGFTFPQNNGSDNHITFDMSSAEAGSNHSTTDNNYIKWTINSAEYSSIRMATGGSFTWGDTAEPVDSERLVFEIGTNGTEGYEFKTNLKQLFFIDQNHLLANVPIRQSHQGNLIEYQDSNKWLLKYENADDGLYWNKTGGSYSFSNTPQLGEYTNPENEANQYVFVQGGAPKAAIDLDTGSFRTAGDVVADNDIIGFVTSDLTYKENIQLFENPLKMIDSIRGVSFDWKQNPSGYSGHDVGVIAQEIEQIIPEAVRTGGYGQKQVNYEKIIPLLIECIKELKAKIEE